MIVKIASKCQVTLPARILDTLGVGPGDHLELTEGPDRLTLRPRRIDHSRLGTLRSKIPPGHPPFQMGDFRKQAYDPVFRV